MLRLHCKKASNEKADGADKKKNAKHPKAQIPIAYSLLVRRQELSSGCLISLDAGVGEAERCRKFAFPRLGVPRLTIS